MLTVVFTAKRPRRTTYYRANTMFRSCARSSTKMSFPFRSCALSSTKMSFPAGAPIITVQAGRMRETIANVTSRGATTTTKTKRIVDVEKEAKATTGTWEWVNAWAPTWPIPYTESCPTTRFQRSKVPVPRLPTSIPFLQPTDYVLSLRPLAVR